MSFSQFFINRPIFAGVIAIIITLAGLIASQVLPIAQYPEIAPPTVVITANYPGASAETLAQTVAAPIEEQLSGVENLIYFSSTAATNGTLTITCTFEVGSERRQGGDRRQQPRRDRAAAAARRRAPERRRGAEALDRHPAGRSRWRRTIPRYDTLFLSNYATINVLDELKRIPGVADVTIFGARDYSMRVWLNPAKMAQLGVTTTDVAKAICDAEQPVRRRQDRREPAPAGQSLVYTVTARGRLDRARGFRQHRPALDRPRRSAAHPRCRADRARRGQLRRVHQSRRQAHGRHRGLPAIGSATRSRSPTRCARASAKLSQELSRRA